MKKVILVLSALLLLGGFGGVKLYLNAKNRAEQAELKLKKEEEVRRQKDALIQFTLKAMDLPPESKLSGTNKQILAVKIANIVVGRIGTQDAQEQYVSMIKIESNFDNTARSPVGATGIGQIMPATFTDAAKNCGLEVKSSDITNEDINLTVGACYFKALLTEQGNNPRLASLAYNGGSKVAAKFKKMADVNQESANYALKTEHVKDLVRSDKSVKREFAGISIESPKVK